MREGPITEIYGSTNSQRPVVCGSQMLSGIVGFIFEAHVPVPRTRAPMYELDYGARNPGPIQVNIQFHNVRKNGRLFAFWQYKMRKNAN